jgi:hypothetical protein
LEERENHAYAVGLRFNLFQTASALKIVQSDVTGMMRPPFLPPDPIQILLALGVTNAREAHPQKAFVQWEQSAAPAQGFAAAAAHFI